MNNVILSYDSLWVYYNQADRDIKEDILKQLDLMDYLPRVGIQVRMEVMRNAPRELKEMFGKVVPLTKKEETYQTELIRIFGNRR